MSHELTCPKCRSVFVEHHMMVDEEFRIWLSCECADCKSEWVQPTETFACPTCLRPLAADVIISVMSGANYGETSG